MAISSASGFSIGSADAIDDRLVLSKSEMKSANDNVFPPVYVCVCKDNGSIYIYNKSNEIDEETGKFRLFKTGTEFKVLVVAELPTEDIDPFTIYFVPAEKTEEGNIYDEFMNVNGSWERIGSTKIDLSNYMTLDSEQAVTGKKNFSEITVNEKKPATSVNNTDADENGNVILDTILPKVITIKTGSEAQARISIATLMSWLSDDVRKYISKGTNSSKVITSTWSYADNDILQLQINGVKYELQLAGVVIEFSGRYFGNDSDMYRIRIHSSPTTGFTLSSGYKAFPVRSIAEYTCNGSGYVPAWSMFVSNSGDIAKGNISDSGDDLNNYTTVGMWRVTDGVRNLPPNMGNNYGQLLVLSGDSSTWVTQIFSVEGDDNNDIWYRKWTGEDDDWGSWTKFSPSNHDHNGSYMKTLDTGVTSMAALKAYTNSSGAFCGSASISDGPAGNCWYNLLWIPHRNGIGGDNADYGRLFMFPMTIDSSDYYILQKRSTSWSGAVKYGPNTQWVSGYLSGTTLHLYTHS